QLLRQVWREGDFSPAESKKFYARYRRHLSQGDHIARLDNLLWDYRRRSASRMLTLVPEGERKLAEARLRLQRRQAGVDPAIRAVPGRLRNDPGLLFDRTRWRRQKRRHNDTIELLLDPPAELERPGMWWFEREFQVRRLLRKRDFVLAYELASRHGQTEGADFAEAEWLAGWLALRFVSKPRRALQHFERLAEGVDRPISTARAAYWAGRAADAIGDDETARRWFERAAALPTTFYGQEAALELGRAPAPAAIAPPTAAQRLAFLSRQPVQATRLLIEAGATAHLTPFLLRLTDAADRPSEVRLVGELAAQSGHANMVTLVGKYAAWQGIIEPVSAFPIPQHPPYVAQRNGSASPAHLLAVTRQESVFSSAVISRAGARGLMQLMPATASVMARDLGVAYNQGLLTGAPDYNIQLGGAYLRRLLRRYDEAALAFAGYNAGPSRVDSWLRLHGDPRTRDRHALIDWIELIPFDETRNYVQRVSENLRVYEQRLAAVDPMPVEPVVVIGPVAPPPVPRLRPPFDDESVTAARQEQEPAEPDPTIIQASYNTPVPWRKPPSDQPAPMPRLKPVD
ncbi:MAG: lytic transglycosylase domain-containing protein, partial [Geminicoccaceae bacterium]|nr:lytic transglycosylase domain-containing protein [Geminicoccaceae bacterium]